MGDYLLSALTKQEQELLTEIDGARVYNTLMSTVLDKHAKDTLGQEYAAHMVEMPDGTSTYVLYQDGKPIYCNSKFEAVSVRIDVISMIG